MCWCEVFSCPEVYVAFGAEKFRTAVVGASVVCCVESEGRGG